MGESTGQQINTTDVDESAPKVEALYLENTLLRVFGVLFCHDPKRARTRTGKIELNKSNDDKNIAIRLDPEYAQPGPFAHKVAVAVIRKQSRYGLPVRKEISFSQRELMRLAGRKSWGGKDSEELAHALRQIRYTHVIASFKSGERFVERDFSIFNEVLIERRSSHRDAIVACTVVLADPIVESLADRHFTCLNYALMQQLGTVGQALYLRLFFHFATRFDGHHASRASFQKRYDAICTEWLGGLTILSYPSHIDRHQLGPHLRRLVETQFLASYSITQAKTGTTGFVITFHPGKAFVADYRRFYANRFRGKVKFDFHADSEQMGEPHKVAYLFQQKRTGQPKGSIPFVSSTDVSTAKLLLEHISFDEISVFLDWALAEAKKTNFDVQTLGGLKQYLSAYVASRPRRQARRARVDDHRQREAQQLEYEQYRRATADQLFSTLPAEEQAAISELARTDRAGGFGPKPGPLAETLFLIARARITEDRYSSRIQSFEDWKGCTQG